jgi:hypothetical protein
MAISIIPTPTAGGGGETWTQIGTTQTPTSGSVVTFSSIPEYKKIRIICLAVRLTSSGTLAITLNNDATAKYANFRVEDSGSGGTGNFATLSMVRAFSDAGANYTNDLIVNYANVAMPKLVTGKGASVISGFAGTVSDLQVTYNSTATINRIDFTAENTFLGANTGTIALYGAN